MSVSTENRSCLACNRPIKGRTDKRFCDDQCRSTYHNHSRPPLSKFVKSVNQHLQKNRTILMQLLDDPSGKSVVTRSRLESLGFAFQYHTHMYTTKKGNNYFYTYEYGFLALRDGRCLLVKQRNEEF